MARARIISARTRSALAPLTQRIAYLEEGDWAAVSRETVEIFDRDNKPVERADRRIRAPRARWSTRAITRISCTRRFTSSRSSSRRRSAPISARSRSRSRCPTWTSISRAIERVAIVACGTASYVGMIGKYWIERFARVPVEVDVASEFRYRDPVLLPNTLGIVVSQSGETADTLAALRHMKANGVDHRRDHQRADQLDGARGRSAAAHPCRAGDRRRLDQGVHLPARGDGRARRQPRPRQGQAQRRRRSRRSSATSSRRRPRSTPRSPMTRRSRRWRTRSPAPATCSISAAARIIRWRWKAR